MALYSFLGSQFPGKGRFLTAQQRLDLPDWRMGCIMMLIKEDGVLAGSGAYLLYGCDDIGTSLRLR